MREKLIAYVRGLFRDAADTPRNRDLEEEILQNTLDRYDDLIAQGVSEENAYTQAAANIGNVRNLWEQPVQASYEPQLRKKRRTGWIICGVLVGLLALVILILGLNFAAPGGLERAEDRMEAIAERVEDVLEGERSVQNNAVIETPQGSGTTEVDAADIMALDINWTAGSVLVEVGTGDKISISETGQQKEEWELVWKEKNGVLSIDFCKANVYVTMPDKDLTVQLPAALADSLQTIRISTTSADVMVDDLFLRNLSLNSVSGNLTADVTCREFRAGTTSGYVTFTGSVQAVEVDTVSGGVSITSSETPHEVSVDTTSGNTLLSIPEDRSFEAEFDTVSGFFTCEHQAPVRNEVHYNGTGNAAEFDFDTVSGNVEILKK